MISIINSRRYNTETATELATYSNTYNITDFNYFCETLYQKSNGEYFLHGEGGANSAYRTCFGSNEYSGGEQIVPLTEAQARRWAEVRLSGEEYEEIFGIAEK